jgi:glycine hydroxymethyltransferase
VGTPAITTRGFGLDETVQLTHWMCDVLDSLDGDNSQQVIADTKAKVLEVCGRFPVYG